MVHLNCPVMVRPGASRRDPSFVWSWSRAGAGKEGPRPGWVRWCLHWSGRRLLGPEGETKAWPSQGERRSAWTQKELRQIWLMPAFGFLKPLHFHSVLSRPSVLSSRNDCFLILPTQMPPVFVCSMDFLVLWLNPRKHSEPPVLVSRGHKTKYYTLSHTWSSQLKGSDWYVTKWIKRKMRSANFQLSTKLNISLENCRYNEWLPVIELLLKLASSFNPHLWDCS